MVKQDRASIRLLSVLTSPVALTGWFDHWRSRLGGVVSSHQLLDHPAETVEQALLRIELQSRRPEPGGQHEPVRAQVEPEAGRVTRRPPGRSPEVATSGPPERRPAPTLAVVVAGLVLLLVVGSGGPSLVVRSLSSGSGPIDDPVPRGATDRRDGDHLKTLGDVIGQRRVTWSSQVKEAQALLDASRMHPVRMTMRADDLFAGKPGRPSMLLEARPRDPHGLAPLRQPPGSSYTIRRLHHAPSDSLSGGAVVRTVELCW